MKDIVIVGGGGHAKMCIDIILSQQSFNIIGIIDNKMLSIGNFNVIGNDLLLPKLYDNGITYAINTIGGGMNLSLRRKMSDKLRSLGFFLPSIFHSKAIIEDSAEIHSGCQIMAGAIVGSYAKLKQDCIVNSGAIVSHDCQIGNNTHITPGAILAGNVTVGNDCLIGMGSTIFYDVKIGNNVIINNGINIYRNLEDNARIKEKV